MELTERFFEFELKNSLFDIRDKNGLRPWEAVRYFVMKSMMKETSDKILIYQKKSFCIEVLQKFYRILEFLHYTISHRNSKNLFLLCSRDIKDGVYYDKISDGLYSLVDESSRFVIESMDKYKGRDYKYDGYAIQNIESVFFRLIRGKFDFSSIYDLIKKEFPQSSLTIDDLNKRYNQFLGEYYFFKLIFRFTHVTKVYLIQCGIKKGLFAAANEKKVKLIELQHGQISINHLLYSYPNNINLSADMIYHPDYLLTFGDFWSKNRHYPGVKDIVIGNILYKNDEVVSDNRGNKVLLVVSNKTEGKLLAKRVIEVLKRKPDFFFYFKLHSNQFEEFNIYKDQFMEYEQVEVISNQKSVKQLLGICEAVLLNDSTVELEALRLGRKVFVLTEQNYLDMDYVLNEKGVYACKDVDDFLNKYDTHKDEQLEPQKAFFMGYDDRVARDIVSI